MPAPAYSASLLPAAQGAPADSVSLAGLKGQAVMLNIWATWCLPCRDEMPAFERLHGTFGDSGLRIVGVSIDARGTDDEVRAFIREFDLSFTILRDPNEQITRVFQAIGVPETFLIDRAGVIVRRWIGQFDPTTPEVADLVRRALTGDPADPDKAASAVPHHPSLRGASPS